MFITQRISFREYLQAVAVAALLVAVSTARAEEKARESVYAPYAFLIGEWNVGADGAKPAVIARFRWGPKESYMWYGVATLQGDKEDPHFEGLLMWNGVRRNLDMLLALDLSGGRVQEQGTMRIEADGTVVRDITAYYTEGVRLPPRGEEFAGPEGATVHFRQTFKAESPDRILTTLMRETPEGWVPTFPGADRMVMTRRT